MACTAGVAAVLSHFAEPTNLAMVFLLGVTYVATRGTRRAAVLASFLSVAVFDFAFVHPEGTFAVADIQYFVTFAVMLIVGLVISGLATHLGEQSAARQEAAAQAQVETARSSLLSSISHDLRTPLAVIEGSADALLAQPELSDQAQQLASTIQQESKRMHRQVQNLLDMNRVHGAISLHRDWHDLDDLITNAKLRVETLFDHPIRLTAPEGLPIVYVDGVLLEQVFVNLLENAAVHAGRGAHVGVEVISRPNTTTLRFVDDGPGLPSGAEARVFERWVGSRRGGFGLGLAICKAAVEAHGGRIEAANRPTGGACFTIELPQTQEASSG